MFNSFAISVDAEYFIFCLIQQIGGLKEVWTCMATQAVLGTERPRNGAGEEEQEKGREIERREKTGAVSSVYLVTALIYYRLL